MIKKFREIALFDNLIANQLCDELASSILINSDYPESFVLTGAAAYALQEPYTDDIPNIIFRITDFESYIKLLSYVDRIPAKELTKFENRTYFKYQAGSIELCVVIMFDSDYKMSTVNYYGILIENATNINRELL